MGLFYQKEVGSLVKIHWIEGLDWECIWTKDQYREIWYGREYVSNELLHICSQIGIQVQHSVPYTPQYNGVAERKNWSLKEMTTCMLESNKLAANFWADYMHDIEYI